MKKISLLQQRIEELSNEYDMNEKLIKAYYHVINNCTIVADASLNPKLECLEAVVKERSKFNKQTCPEDVKDIPLSPMVSVENAIFEMFATEEDYDLSYNKPTLTDTDLQLMEVYYSLDNEKAMKL